MADIQGTYDDLFAAVPNALAGLLDEGDAGGSVSVFVDGEPVVDVNQMREPADDNRGLELVMAAYDGLQGLRAGKG